MMKTLKFLTLFLAISAIITSCKKDPDPILISTFIATGTSFEDGSAVTKDLNGATSAVDVPLNSIITITFDKAVDGATVINSNININGLGSDVSLVLNSSGSTVTIDPDSDLERGTLYSININGLKATDEGEFISSSRTFTTEGRAPVVVPNADDMLAYWPFDGTPNDLSGNYPADRVESITYGEDRFGQGNSVASFDGDASIIEIPNADDFMAGGDFTLSFWVNTNSVDHVDAGGNPSGHFVMGLAAFKGFQFEIPGDYGSCKLATQYMLPDGSTTPEDTWFNGDGKNKDNGGWQGWDFAADITGSGGVAGLVQDKWAHIICTYNAELKQGRMYINGDLMKGFDFNLWPDGDPKKDIVGVGYGGVEPSELPVLAFGFIHSSGGTLWDDTPWGDYDKPTSNHFKGDLDDIRIFSTAYTSNDVKDLYNAEKN